MDVLVQHCSNSSADAMELPQLYTKASLWQWNNCDMMLSIVH